MAPDAPVNNAPTNAAAALTAFHALILADPALPATLGAIECPDDFAAIAISIARQHGIALTAEAVTSHRKTLPFRLDHWPPPGWLPVRSVPTGAGLAIDWTWVGAQPLTEPFYEDSVRRHAVRPFNRLLRPRTLLEALVTGARADLAAPDGLIFHMSRCGSTLVAQLLATVVRHRVVSEAEPVDAVVQWCATSGQALPQQVAVLRAIVGAVGRDKAAGERLFVKLDAWHTRALPLFRAAFPLVPWIFLYRDPIEVLASHRARPGLVSFAGGLPPDLLDLGNDTAAAPEDHCAAALARIGSAVLDHWPIGGGLLVDYAELPQATVGRIAPHFGITLDAAEAATMLARSASDAKAPDIVFMPDLVGKRAAASPHVRRAADVPRPIHARLDAPRHRHAGR